MIDDDRKEVTVDGEIVKLTPIEYRILLLLVKNQGLSFFSTNQIYESIWEEEAIAADNTVAVHIRHISEKRSRSIRKNHVISRLCGDLGTRWKRSELRPFVVENILHNFCTCYRDCFIIERNGV